MFVSQSFRFADLGIVAFLVLLEALLSADNALVLAIMVRHLPRRDQQRALLYGLGGAFIFRFLAILAASFIIQLWWLQAIGALYLLYLPFRHFLARPAGPDAKPVGTNFWRTVVAVEVTDIAFAVDSVLAGVSTVGDHPEKLWVVYLGAVIGVVLLRFAAGAFVRLLERYPNLDDVAYALVGWVAIKLSFMAAHNYGRATVEAGGTPLFRSHELPQTVFWLILAAIAIVGGWLAVRSGRKPVPPEECMADEVEDQQDFRIDEE